MNYITQRLNGATAHGCADRSAARVRSLKTPFAPDDAHACSAGPLSAPWGVGARHC